MSQLIQMIKIAEENKPSFGSACNHCGWCCMTEVCPTALALGTSEEIPCKHLYEADGNHLCSLASSDLIKELLAMGKGCDAKTQKEAIEEFNRNQNG